MSPRFALFASIALLFPRFSFAGEWNELILEQIKRMPSAGSYARYEKEKPEGQRFDQLYRTVDDLEKSLSVGLGGRLRVKPEAAAEFSFCSSATYLLFCSVISELQKNGNVSSERALSEALAWTGGSEPVIHGKLDGVGIFGHWNANGPGTAVLFERLELGQNFSSFEKARAGDILKIFWNEHIGKGERGHLVVYLGANENGSAIQVWSSNLTNENGSSGYGTMWVERSRIQRAVFSRLEKPENLVKWLSFSEPEWTSDYLVRILETGSTVSEMHEVIGIER